MCEILPNWAEKVKETRKIKNWISLICGKNAQNIEA